jgi:hypothetical protein
MANHLIIDLETLGIHQDSVILQITAAMHNTKNKDTLFESLDIKNYKLQAKPQAELGRIVDPDTVRWWREQHVEVQQQAFIPHASDWEPAAALNDLAAWMKQHKFNKYEDYIWQRGSMDTDWLVSLFMSYGWVWKQVPIPYHRVRDIRTTIDVLGMSSKLNGYPDNTEELRAQIPGYKQHDALSDVKFEILSLHEAGIF